LLLIKIAFSLDALRPRGSFTRQSENERARSFVSVARIEFHSYSRDHRIALITAALIDETRQRHPEHQPINSISNMLYTSGINGCGA
jgi:hypothetical protein